MLDGDGHGTIGDRGQEGGGPGRGVAPAERHFVAGLETTVAEEDVELGYLARDVVILQRRAFVVGERIPVPVVFDAIFYIRVETLCRLHCTI